MALPRAALGPGLGRVLGLAVVGAFLGGHGRSRWLSLGATLCLVAFGLAVVIVTSHPPTRVHGPRRLYLDLVEYVATVVILLILFGPIAWAIIAGRRVRGPRYEDRDGAAVIGEQIRRRSSDGRGG